jgi:hypothetical protein
MPVIERQRDVALALANKVRLERSELKRDLKAGRLSIADVLRDPPLCVERIKVFELLLAVPKLWRVKAERAMRHCGMQPWVRLNALSEVRREQLCRELEPWW